MERAALRDPASELPQPTTVRAIKLVGGGRTLAHADGATWMVRGGLPGELLVVEPVRRRARIIEAEAVQVVADPHPARLAKPCPHASSCGGCDWPHVDAEKGAALKAMVAAEASRRHPDLSARLLGAPVTPSPPAYRLRSRLHWDPQNRALGFYGHQSWTVGAIPDCGVITETLKNRLAGLEAILARRCPSPVDLDWLEADDGAVAALRAARKGARIPEAAWVPTEKECPDLVGFHRLGATSEVVPGWGRDHVHMELPVRLRVPIGSFFQGNRHLVPWLFDRVVELVGPGSDPVVDLHGGVGFLAGAAWSAGHRKLTVIEPHAGAAAAARANLPDADVVTGTAEGFLENAVDIPSSTIAIADPPRSGMSAALRRRLAAWRPRRVVSLGCDPATWSRDASFLIERGYRCTQLELVDLFAFTHHVEILAVLETG
jgi:23S rRNA (uracil1939-C5)-methyltransferase